MEKMKDIHAWIFESHSFLQDTAPVHPCATVFRIVKIFCVFDRMNANCSGTWFRERVGVKNL
jgi:hypothetical protein